jgi:uncharacterized protein YkwD
MSSVRSVSPGRAVRQGLLVLAVTVGLAVPSLRVVGAVLDADGPMVARAASGAERVASGGPTAATPAPPPDGTAALAAEVVRLANVERAAAGRSALATDPAVTRAAVDHSADQAATGRMSHTGSDGSDAGTRLTRAGFEWRTWGENVAVGQRTAADVMSAWMASPSHRENILSGSFTKIGVGAVTDAGGRTFWTMVLAA